MSIAYAIKSPGNYNENNRTRQGLFEKLRECVRYNKIGARNPVKRHNCGFLSFIFPISVHSERYTLPKRHVLSGFLVQNKVHEYRMQKVANISPARCEIYPVASGVLLVSLLLTLNIFHNLFYRFYY